MKDKYHLIIAIPLDVAGTCSGPKVQESSSEKESRIYSKPATQKYENGWERIFGNKSQQSKPSELPN